MNAACDWDDLMVSLGLEPSTPRISPLMLLAHPPVPCGTVRGYNRHRTNGEQPCRACKDAYNAAQNARRAAKCPPKQLGALPAPREHGTPRGARHHWKYGEPVCEACRDAYNAWQAQHRARRKTSA